MTAWLGRSAWVFVLAFGLSIAIHVAFAALLLSHRSETPGVPAPPTTAISVNLEASDILDSPQEDQQTATSVKQEAVQRQDEVTEDKPEDKAPPPEPEIAEKAVTADEETDKRQSEAAEQQKLAEEAQRQTEEAEKLRLAEEAQRQTEETEQQRLAEEALRKADEADAEQQRLTAARRVAESEAERRREQERRIADERRRLKREAEQRDEQRARREQAEQSAEDAERRKREKRVEQKAAEALEGRQRSTGRVSASRGSTINYGAILNSYIARNKPSNPGGGGQVTVSFGVSPSGGLTHARVLRSSGNSALDQAALAGVRRVAPFPRPPAGITAAQLTFQIPIRFR